MCVLNVAGRLELGPVVNSHLHWQHRHRGRAHDDHQIHRRRVWKRGVLAVTHRPTPRVSPDFSQSGGPRCVACMLCADRVEYDNVWGVHAGRDRRRLRVESLVCVAHGAVVLLIPLATARTWWSTWAAGDQGVAPVRTCPSAGSVYTSTTAPSCCATVCGACARRHRTHKRCTCVQVVVAWPCGRVPVLTALNQPLCGSCSLRHQQQGSW